MLRRDRAQRRSVQAALTHHLYWPRRVPRLLAQDLLVLREFQLPPGKVSHLVQPVSLKHQHHLEEGSVQPRRGRIARQRPGITEPASPGVRTLVAETCPTAGAVRPHQYARPGARSPATRPVCASLPERMDTTNTSLDPRLFTPPMGMPPVPTALHEEDDNDADQKRRRKERRAFDSVNQPLDPWQRYKALSDVFDSEQDLVDLADHKARFALMIMGAINAGVFLASARAPTGTLSGAGLGRWVGAALVAYAASALYFFVQSIEALRPRGKAGSRPLPADCQPDTAMGVRFYHDILARPFEEYQKMWGTLRVDNLNAELCGQIHVLAGINRAKYAALRRLYTGLKVMTVMAAVVLFGLLLLLRI